MADSEDCVIFFTGEGDGREERRVKKSQVSAERLAQMFGVSHKARKLLTCKHVLSGSSECNAVDEGTLTFI